MPEDSIGLLVVSHLVTFLVGVVVCYKAEFWWAHRVRRQTNNQEGDTMPTQDGKRQWDSGVWALLIGGLAMILAGISIASNVRASDCLSDYANRAAEASQARATAGDKLRAADTAVDLADDRLTTAIATVLQPGATRADVPELRAATKAKQEAAARRVRVRAELQEELKQHPLPDPPREVCG